MGFKDATNWQAFDYEMRRELIEYNQKAVKFLQALGEKVVKYARTDQSNALHYTDRTGNLRNSIGYIVVQDGRVLAEAFEGNTPPSQGYTAGDGNAIGRQYALDVAEQLSKSKTYLVWVAGMEYASYVEAKGYDVIQGSGDWLESRAEKERQAFQRYLKSKKR